MEKTPKEIRALILAQLEPVDYVHAIESSHFWWDGIDTNDYENKKKAYIKELEKRKKRESFDEAMRLFGAREGGNNIFGGLTNMLPPNWVRLAFLFHQRDLRVTRQ